MLISFLLPVAFAGPLSSIPDRLLGWSIAGVVSLIAVAVILPAPSVEPLVDLTCVALTKIAQYLEVVSRCDGDADAAELTARYTDANEAPRRCAPRSSPPPFARWDWVRALAGW